MKAKNRTWKSCGSKRRYRDEHTANQYRKKYELQRGVKLDYYYCQNCKGYHLTSTPVNYARYGYDEEWIMNYVS